MNNDHVQHPPGGDMAPLGTTSCPIETQRLLKGVQLSYNNADSYADATVRLCDGREIPFHKNILSFSNDRLKAMIDRGDLLPHCGPQCPDPAVHSEAIELFVRYKYGHAIPNGDEKSRDLWFRLASVAQAAGEHALSSYARENFLIQARQESHMEAIVDMLPVVEAEFPDTAKTLRVHHAVKLHDSRRFQSMLKSDINLMWENCKALVAVARSADA